MTPSPKNVWNVQIEIIKYLPRASPNVMVRTWERNYTPARRIQLLATPKRIWQPIWHAYARPPGFIAGLRGAEDGSPGQRANCPGCLRATNQLRAATSGRRGGRGGRRRRGGVDGGWQRALEPDVINTEHQVKSDTLPPTYGPFLWKRWPASGCFFSPI